MFAGLKILQHSVSSDEAFSRLSLILLSFTTFQVVADLGTQTEFLRAWHHVDANKRPALCHVLIQTRMLLGILTLGVAGLYGWFSEFSPAMISSFLIYHLCFLPFAFISTADSLFLAKQEFTKAIFARVSRLIALTIFLFAAARTHGENEFIIPFASTLTFSVVALFTWQQVLRPTLATPEPLGLLSHHWWARLGHDTQNFFRGSLIAAFVIIIHSSHGILSHGILVRGVGENQLTALNTAVALATPATLAFQTLVQLVNSNLATWTKLSSTELVQRYLTLFVRLTALLAVMLAGVWIAHQLQLIEWFFPRANAMVIPLCLSLISAHWILNFATPAIIVCQYQRRTRHLLILMATAGLLACFAQQLWMETLREYAYIVSLTLMGGLTALGGIVISLKTAKASPVSS